MLALLKYPFIKTQKPHKSSPRDLRFELLRLLAMFLIVLCHASIYLAQLNYRDSLPHSIYRTIANSGQIGVSIFFIISGYFCCKSKFNLGRILKVILHTWLYSITIAAIIFLSFYLFHCPQTIAMMSKQDIWYNISLSAMPILRNAYWFLTAYALILMPFTPLLNTFVEHVSKQRFKAILYIAYILTGLSYFIMPTIKTYVVISYPVVMYLTGSYIRLYAKDIKLSNLKLWCSIAGGIVAMWLINYFGTSNTISRIFGDQFSHILLYCNNILVPQWIIAAAITIIATRRKPMMGTNRLSKLIRMCGASTFGVYLIHENPLLYQPLWNFINRSLAPLSELSGIYRLLIVIGSSIMVFIVCITISIIYDVLVTNRLVNTIIKLQFMQKLTHKLDCAMNS